MQRNEERLAAVRALVKQPDQYFGAIAERNNRLFGHDDVGDQLAICNLDNVANRELMLYLSSESFAIIMPMLSSLVTKCFK